MTSQAEKSVRLMLEFYINSWQNFDPWNIR